MSAGQLTALFIGLVAWGSSACGTCKQCVPLTVHLASKDGAALAPLTVAITSKSGLSRSYQCGGDNDGGLDSQCTVDGVIFTSTTDELAITATAKSGERGSTVALPTYVKRSEGACGPCLLLKSPRFSNET